jgi:hypothetical protein
MGTKKTVFEAHVDRLRDSAGTDPEEGAYEQLGWSNNHRTTEQDGYLTPTSNHRRDYLLLKLSTLDFHKGTK